MARHGMHNSTDLAPLRRQRGIDLSPSPVYRIVTQRPERVSLRLMSTLADIFECGPEDLLTFTAADAKKPRKAARRREGTNVRGAVHTSKQEITEVDKFLTWLAGRGKTIGDCTPADLDEYLAGGPTTRHMIRTFTVWSTKHRVSCPLTIYFRRARSARMITQDDRLDWIGRCLVGDVDTLPYRVAAALLLLYAQQLVRIAALRTEQIQVALAEIRILLGEEAAAVPEPFAQLLGDHLVARPNLRTANTDGSPWLFPSTRAGQHLHQTRSWTGSGTSASTYLAPQRRSAISSAECQHRSSPPISATAIRSPSGTPNSPPSR